MWYIPRPNCFSPQLGDLIAHHQWKCAYSMFWQPSSEFLLNKTVHNVQNCSFCETNGGVKTMISAIFFIVDFLKDRKIKKQLTRTRLTIAVHMFFRNPFTSRISSVVWCFASPVLVGLRIKNRLRFFISSKHCLICLCFPPSHGWVQAPEFSQDVQDESTGNKSFAM